MSPCIESRFTLALFLLASSLFAASASNDAIGHGKGGGSADLEKEADKTGGKKSTDGPVTLPHLEKKANRPELGKKPVVIYVMGVSGCGKSTMGMHIAQLLSISYTDGDALHTPEAVEQMRQNIPLTDSDRIPWLKRLQAHAIAELEKSPNGCVIAASSLKYAYREIQRGHAVPPGLNDAIPNGLPAAERANDVRTLFIWLDGSQAVLSARMKTRSGHYMKKDMLLSQIATLERPPVNDEQDVIRIDIDPPEETVKERASAAIRHALSLDL